MLETFTTIATTLGLPVACLVVLAFFCWQMYTNFQEDTKRQGEFFREELNAQREHSSEREKIFYEQLTGFRTVLQEFQETLEKINVRLDYIEQK
jgi:hypothetical protein